PLFTAASPSPTSTPSLHDALPISHPKQRTWNQRDDGALLMEEVSLDLKSSRVINRLMLIEPQGGARVTKEFDLRTYTCAELTAIDRKSTRLNSSHDQISYAVFCLT